MEWADAETGVAPNEVNKACTVLTNYLDRGTLKSYENEFAYTFFWVEFLVYISQFLGASFILGTSAMLFPSPQNSQYEDSLGVLYRYGSFSVSIVLDKQNSLLHFHCLCL